MTEDRIPFVPVAEPTIESLVGSVTTACEAERALAEAVEAMLELSQDLSMDAVRGLRERGASAAQIERYEVAQREASARVRARLHALGDALETLESEANGLR